MIRRSLSKALVSSLLLSVKSVASAGLAELLHTNSFSIECLKRWQKMSDRGCPENVSGMGNYRLIG
jgi:hypothetical protein